MIREERAQAIVYEPSTDTARILVQTGEGPPAFVRREVDLLLDAKGHLVGLDLRGEGFKRKVVMLGPHESVASTATANVSIAHVAGGDEVTEILVQGARNAIRAHEKSPYL